MQIDENSLYIEAIKLAAGSVQYKNWSVQDTFMDAVSQLYQYYQNSQNIKYLENTRKIKNICHAEQEKYP